MSSMPCRAQSKDYFTASKEEIQSSQHIGLATLRFRLPSFFFWKVEGEQPHCEDQYWPGVPSLYSSTAPLLLVDCWIVRGSIQHLVNLEARIRHYEHSHPLQCMVFQHVHFGRNCCRWKCFPKYSHKGNNWLFCDKSNTSKLKLLFPCSCTYLILVFVPWIQILVLHEVGHWAKREKMCLKLSQTVVASSESEGLSYSYDRRTQRLRLSQCNTCKWCEVFNNPTCTCNVLWMWFPTKIRPIVPFSMDIECLQSIVLTFQKGHQ